MGKEGHPPSSADPARKTSRSGVVILAGVVSVRIGPPLTEASSGLAKRGSGVVGHSDARIAPHARS